MFVLTNILLDIGVETLRPRVLGLSEIDCYASSLRVMSPLFLTHTAAAAPIVVVLRYGRDLQLLPGTGTVLHISRLVSAPSISSGSLLLFSLKVGAYRA